MAKFVALVFFLFALILIKTAVGSPLTATNDHREQCGPNVTPGILQMLHGVDKTTVDYHQPPGKDGFRSKLFDLTCTKSNHLTPFQQPDQIEFLQRVNVFLSFCSDKIINECDEAQATFSKQLESLNLDSFGDFFRHFGISKNNQTILKTYYPVFSHEIEYDTSKLVLSQKAREMLDTLPARYVDNPSMYDRLLDTLGTHYISRATFGGYIQLRTTIDQQYLEKVGTEVIKSNMHEWFRKFANNDPNLSFLDDFIQLTDQQRKEFAENAQELEFTVFGGQIAPPPMPKSFGSLRLSSRFFNSRNASTDIVVGTRQSRPDDGNWFKEWRSSVPQNPWLIDAFLVHIDVLAGRDFDLTVQLYTASMLKQARALLASLENVIQVCKFKPSVKQMVQLGRIDAALKQPIASEDDSNQRESQIRKLFSSISDNE